MTGSGCVVGVNVASMWLRVDPSCAVRRALGGGANGRLRRGWFRERENLKANSGRKAQQKPVNTVHEAQEDREEQLASEEHLRDNMGLVSAVTEQRTCELMNATKAEATVPAGEDSSPQPHCSR